MQVSVDRAEPVAPLTLFADRYNKRGRPRDKELFVDNRRRGREERQKLAAESQPGKMVPRGGLEPSVWQ